MLELKGLRKEFKKMFYSTNNSMSSVFLFCALCTVCESSLMCFTLSCFMSLLLYCSSMYVCVLCCAVPLSPPRNQCQGATEEFKLCRQPVEIQDLEG